MTPTLYGVILEMEGEEPFWFLSPNANEYLEVRQFPFPQAEDEAQAMFDLLTARLAGEGNFLPMRMVRRFFAQQETRPDTTVTFDGRIWPPVRTKAEADTGGLPEDVGYRNLGTTRKNPAA